MADAICKGRQLNSGKSMKDPRLDKIVNLILAFAQGDLDQRIDISGEADEIDAIGLGLNMLGEELSYSKTQLALREKKLNETLIKMQSANKELEQFAYIVSHDLQEPLRMITSFLKLLEMEMEGKLDENSKEYIHFTVDGAERMKVLINDLLEYSRIGTNSEKFTLTDFNEVVKDVLQVLEENIQETGALISVKPLPSLPANRSLISQLFLNLIGNAIKYRDHKIPQVEIGSIEEAENWKFYVNDNGIGIDPRYYDKIFVMFQRIHSKSEYKGTGIGLAICKKVVQSHGGNIWVESQPGIGSTFYFTIPK
jgi:light-regulated signal transduction histidine kinase (bacteriophytochrome)